MACYHPLSGYYSKIRNSSGKRSIVFNPKMAVSNEVQKIPCGQCIGCRLERSRQWAVRCMHEASMHKENSFITLTYSNENLPENGSLHFPDFQKFMKRLRKKYAEKTIRFFHCGEYGERYGRPHYHCCLFGFDFKDKKLYNQHRGHKYYNSETLQDLWNNQGYCVIGNLTFDSAAYTARYITKKINGPRAEEHYKGKEPEYTTMSRKPGIGKLFVDKYVKSIYKDDTIIIKGKKMQPPKYYDSQFEIMYPEEYKEIKRNRRIKAEKNEKENHWKRLQVKEKIQRLNNNKLKRGYENGNTDICSF